MFFGANTVQDLGCADCRTQKYDEEHARQIKELLITDTVVVVHVTKYCSLP